MDVLVQMKQEVAVSKETEVDSEINHNKGCS